MSSMRGSVEHYLGQWLISEKALYDELWSSGKIPRCTGLWLAKLVRHFDLSRNFPKSGKSDGKEVPEGVRFGRYVKIVEEAAKITNRIDSVTCLATAFGKLDRHNYLLSAASKIIWMYDRDNTLIFDRRVRTALDRMREPNETKLPDRDYEKFSARWEGQYKLVRADIVKACRGMRLNCEHDVLQEKWFHRRVFDIWLWDAGGRHSTGNNVVLEIE